MIEKFKGKKTISLALAQIIGTWSFYFISPEMTLKIAIGYTLFAIAQAVNRFFTDEPLSLPFQKK